MEEFKIGRGGLPVGIVSAAIVTLLLFIALPLLTQLHNRYVQQKKVEGAIISTRKPAPPPTEEQNQAKEQQLQQAKAVPKEMQEMSHARPKFNVPHATLAMGGSGIGTIKIGEVKNFHVSASLFTSAFNLNEVDQPPRVLRAFPPQYPYLAKRDNIQGKIILKFVVGTDGRAKEAEVVEADPPSCMKVFKDSALKAVARYLFKPAIKDGKPVLCIVRLPISFTLE